MTDFFFCIVMYIQVKQIKEKKRGFLVLSIGCWLDGGRFAKDCKKGAGFIKLFWKEKKDLLKYYACTNELRKKNAKTKGEEFIFIAFDKLTYAWANLSPLTSLFCPSEQDLLKPRLHQIFTKTQRINLTPGWDSRQQQERKCLFG